MGKGSDSVEGILLWEGTPLRQRAARQENGPDEGDNHLGARREHGRAKLVGIERGANGRKVCFDAHGDWGWYAFAETE